MAAGWSRGQLKAPGSHDRPFYHRAAALLDELAAQRGSLRSLASRHQVGNDAKRLLALCMQALRYRPVLELLLEKTRLLERERKALQPRKGSAGPSAASLGLCLAHDALFAKRGISLPKDHALHQAIARHLPALRAEKAREMVRRGLSKDEDLQIDLPAHLGPASRSRAADDGDELEAVRVRWLRVNTLKWTTREAIAWLRADGFLEVSAIERLSASPRSFAYDAHLPMLLGLPPTFDLQACKPYLDGRFIAQDKASCFPAYILAAGTTSAISAIDATAAPGNKTTMLSALLSPAFGSVVAFERDPERFKILVRMLKSAQASNARAVLGDFMATDPADPSYAAVTHLLVDPSCSGSGIVSRMDALSQPGAGTDTARLKALSGFQVAILSHAMRFATAQRIVYSTCSVHALENEGVVERVLRKPEFAEWSVAPRSEVLPSWPHRGVEGYPFSKDVIRCDPARDLCNGFFVACLVRNARATAEPPLSSPEREPEPAYESSLSPSAPPQRHWAKTARRKHRRGPIKYGRWRITLHAPEPDKL